VSHRFATTELRGGSSSHLANASRNGFAFRSTAPFFGVSAQDLRYKDDNNQNVPGLDKALQALQPYFKAFPLPSATSPEKFVSVPCDPTADPICPPGGQKQVATGSAAFNASYSNPGTLDAYSVRIDHKLTNTLTVFGRYNYSPSEIDVRGGSGSSTLNTVSATRITTQTATVGATWFLSQRVANDLRFNYEYVRYHRSLRTFRTYRPILEHFKSFCTKTHVDDVGRQDLLDFATHCLKEGQKGKSVYNKLVVLSQVMKQHRRPKLLNASDWPSFVETVRPIYEDFELTKLFNACTPSEEIRFKFYLMSGFRDAEGCFVTWRDVDFKHMAVRVTAKSHWGFHPKNWEEWEVPVPQKLIALLQKFKPADAGPDDPLFPSATGRPNAA